VTLAEVIFFAINYLQIFKLLSVLFIKLTIKKYFVRLLFQFMIALQVRHIIGAHFKRIEKMYLKYTQKYY